MLAPMATLKGVDTERIQLNPEQCLRHAETILSALEEVRRKVTEVYSQPYSGPDDRSDPDRMLYSGGFFSSGDRHLMKKVLVVPPSKLRGHLWSFQDSRLPLMLFRYRARNFPESLIAEEREAWDKDRRARLVETRDPAYFTLEDFHRAMQELRADKKDEPGALRILDKLDAWVVATGLAEL
jgi:exodeoxyribonuclease-1